MKTLQTISSTLCSLILIATTATLACSTAAARDPNAAPQRVVSFADLNLNHAEGVKTLYNRLSTAARAVCKPQPSYPYMLRADSRKCVSTSLANAVAIIDNPNLTAYVENRATTGDTRVKLASRR